MAAISTASVTLLGLANAYGGIGGGFHTLQMTMNLPAGAVTTGTNTISFRFNGTDGVDERIPGFGVQYPVRRKQPAFVVSVCLG